MGKAVWANELLGQTLLVKGPNGQVVEKPTEEALADKKKVLLYFSASWCGPCRSFTPLLTVAYEDAVEADPADVEIVFVTADFDSASFSEYFGKMPWAAVPFKAGNPIGQALGDVFGVRGIPALIALSGDDGSVLSTEARSLVQSKRSFAALDALPKQPPRHRGQHGAVVEEGATLWSLISDFLLCGLFCARRRGQPGGKDE